MGSQPKSPFKQNKATTCSLVAVAQPISTHTTPATETDPKATAIQQPPPSTHEKLAAQNPTQQTSKTESSQDSVSLTAQEAPSTATTSTAATAPTDHAQAPIAPAKIDIATIMEALKADHASLILGGSYLSCHAKPEFQGSQIPAENTEVKATTTPPAETASLIHAQPQQSAAAQPTAHVQVIDTQPVTTQPTDQFPLHAAAQTNSYSAIQRLLTENPTIINNRNAQGHTALHVAVIHQKVSAIDTLLNSINIDVNAVDNNGLTPLHYAVEIGNEILVSTLLSKNADPNIKKTSQRGLWGDRRSPQEQDDDDCRTPLHIAAHKGYVNIARKLLDNQPVCANINARNYFNATPLFEAVNAGHAAIVDLLLEKNADCNLYVNRDRGWITCTGEVGLHACNIFIPYVVLPYFSGGLVPIIDFCLEPESSVYRRAARVYGNHPIMRGQTPLHCACLHGNKEIVQKLIAKKAHIDAKDDDGSTPLFLAAQKGFDEIVKILIDANANVNRVFAPLRFLTLNALREQTTSLVEACKNGHIKTVALLLEAGANPHFDNDKALDSALRKNKKKHERNRTIAH